MDGENDEDLTFLTLLNRARITKFLFFSFTLYIYNMLYGLSLSKIILLKNGSHPMCFRYIKS